MSVEHRTVIALKWTAAARLLGQITSWLVTLVVIRILSPADYGLMALVAVVVSLAANIAELGLGASVVQARELDRPTLRQLCGLIVIMHLLLGLAVAAVAPLATWVFGQPLTALIQVAALQFLFIAASAIPQSMATRAMDFKWLAQVEVTAGVITSMTTLLLAWKGFAVWSLVLGALAGQALRAVVLVAKGESVRPEFRFDRIGKHFGFGARLATSRIIWILVSQADVMIGGRLLTRDALGVYSVALHLATLPMQKLMSVVNLVAFPAVARLQEERDRLHLRLLQASRLLAAVVVPALWGLSAVAPELVRLALGDKWNMAVFPLRVVALVVPLRMMASLFNTAVAAVGRAESDLRNMIVTVIVWPTCFLIGSHWGSDGLAISWLCAVPLSTALNFPRTSRSLGIGLGELAAHVRAPVLAGAAMFVSVHAGRMLLNGLHELPRLGALIALGAGIYIPLVLLLDRRLSVEVGQFLRAFRGEHAS